MVAVKIEIQFFGEDDYREVEFTGNPHKCDDGIGSYEYFGFRGNDSRTYVSCEDTIDWDRKLYSDSENAIIEKHLEKNEEEIDKKLCED